VRRLSEIIVGNRVRTEDWPDLWYQSGVVRQIDKAWAQVLWDRRDLGASWVPIGRLIEQS
jgi:hypothetical protein